MVSKEDFSWWSVGYIVDAVVSAIVIIVANVISDRVLPFRAKIPMSDKNPAVSFPFLKNSISSSLNVCISYGSAILTSLFWNLVAHFTYCKPLSESLHDFHHSVLGVVVSAGVCQLLECILKVFAGRPRPHFFSRLEEAEKYAIEHNFTQSKKESYVHSQRIKSYQSFPSGHSATAFCGFTFMALYLCGKIHMWSVQQGYIQGSTKPKLLQGNLWKILFVCLPILAASLIAVSRTRDYHHNYSDIVAGSALGVFSACIVYFSYFNPLTAENSDLPKHY